jgi:transcription elongation factor GreA-like protein
VTFHEWYKTAILPRLYDEQAEYEKHAVAFQAIDKLSREDIINLYQSMSLGELKLSLFDHVKSCIAEQWDPDGDPPEFRDES